MYEAHFFKSLTASRSIPKWGLVCAHGGTGSPAIAVTVYATAPELVGQWAWQRQLGLLWSTLARTPWVLHCDTIFHDTVVLSKVSH